jgi:hypothetical protein
MSFRAHPANCFGSILKFAARRKGAGVLVMSAALSLAASIASSQTVGVTSAAVGDPLGKPPLEIERILHVGVDVKANELITTGSADRAQLVFLDGTALSVGPEAQLVIDNFVYDSDRKLGELTLSATRGVFRFVGGNISKMKAVTITTPSSAIAIRGGIMMVAVEPAETRATFLFGYTMTVTGGGKSQVVTRPGWGVRTISGHAPEQAMQISAAALAGQMAILEGSSGRPAGPGAPNGANSPGGPASRAPLQRGQSSSNASSSKEAATTTPGLKKSETVDEAMSKSGLSEVNSGRGPHAQGRVVGGPAPGDGRGDGSAKGGPRLPGDITLNRPLLPENMGASSPLPSGPGLPTNSGTRPPP